MFHEYPKALYRRGEYAAVANSEEEALMRKEGWKDWLEDHQDMAESQASEQEPKKRGRPAKG